MLEELKPRPVHPSTSIPQFRPPRHPRPVRFEQRARWCNGYGFEEEREPALLSPDDLEEGGGNWFNRMNLESPMASSQTGVAKKKKKPYKPKVKSLVSIGSVNEKGFGPPRPCR